MTKKTKLIIHTDGGARGNPGPAAAGAVIARADTGAVIDRLAVYLGDYLTNNQAEYQAVLLALERVIELGYVGSDLEFVLDSELVVNQLSQRFKIKDKELGSLFVKIWNLTQRFGTVTYQHVRREENKEADRLVNQALDQRLV